jgi:transketolase
MDNPVVIVAVGAGYAYGPQGYTHHALEDIAVMRALPNIEVIVPADPIEASLITKLLCMTKSPTYLRLGKSNEQNINQREPVLSPGKFNEIVSGNCGTILFVGSIGKTAVTAAGELLGLGYSVSVTSVPFLTSLDEEYLVRAADKGPIITVEEHSSRGGFGSAVLEFFNDARICVSVGIIAAEQSNLSLVGDQEFLLRRNALHSSDIVQKFRALKES